jgi:hypothetical protein
VQTQTLILPPGFGHYHRSWADSAHVDLDALLNKLRQLSSTAHGIDADNIRRAGATPVNAFWGKSEARTYVYVSPVAVTSDSTVAAVYWECFTSRHGQRTISFYRRSSADRWRPWHFIVYSTE